MIAENPEPKFTQFPFHPEILEDVAAAGYVTPTPIQAQCIAPALEGKDIIGVAQTGTGKTAAFALPIIQRVARRPEMAALVLAPTRELAQQIATTFTALGKSSGINVAVVVGGIPIKEDYRALQSWPNVLIATPGRLIDHIQCRSIVLKEIEVLVVDEADRMHDMGFIPQIRRIIAELPDNRQTLMFTATMPDDVEQIARRSMRSPVRIQVGLQVPAARAEQKLYHVSEDDKMPLLIDLLGQVNGRVLVFARTKRKVERLARTVSRRYPGVTRLHSDREQPERDAAMAGFREGRYRILIATDIAARGLDVADIEHVINYDFPGSAEDYIHRIGRTARVAASGLATSFVTGADRPCLRRLENLIDTRLELVPYGEPGAAREAQPAHRHSDSAESNGRRPRRRSRSRGRARTPAN